MAKKLFQTNINHLQKVRNQLSLHQTMNGKQIILGYENCQKIQQANQKINEAINLLDQIKKGENLK